MWFSLSISINEPCEITRVERIHSGRLLSRGTQCEIHPAVVGQNNVAELPDDLLTGVITQAGILSQQLSDLVAGQIKLFAECLSVDA